MLTRFSGFFLVIALISLPSVAADKNEVAIQAFRDAGAGSYIDASYGYAVFPSIGKAGLLVGGAHGKGAVYREGNVIGKSTMTQVSLGIQFGGQVYKQIVFFEDARSMREFTSGDFEFSGQAAAVALNSGASAEISTGGGGRVSVTAANGESTEVDSAGFVDGMAVFTLSQGGFMVEVSIGGQRFSYEPL
jgi:lipid-binding SYLF domain-containing protein